MANYPLEIFKSQICGKEVAVIGIGVSNIPLIKFLSKLGARITACDKKSRADLGIVYQDLKRLGVNFSLGDEYLKNVNKQFIFKTPGMRSDIPELVLAKQQGSVISSEIELFMRICPAQIIGVTGSDGKTTTSTLIHKMLVAEGHNAYLGGNIGRPLINDIWQMSTEDKVVLELSSFQLHNITVSPQISVITNIYPNHLDMHTSMQEYIDAKRNIYRFQNEYDKLIINLDNELTAASAKESKGETVYFSSKHPVERGAYMSGNHIHIANNEGDFEVVCTDDILIPGTHNIENFMAAIAAVWGMVSLRSIQNVARTFGGVEHRIEHVKTARGIKYYNDSIASSPTRTRAALNSFDQKVILIAGGYDKNIPFDEFGTDVVQHVKTLILAGATAPKIAEAVKNAEEFSDNNPVVINCNNLASAVKTAYQTAKPGDIVLFSPACASFDAFKNFEERGKYFKSIVEDLH